MSPNLLFWRKKEAGKRWQVFDSQDRLLGFIRWEFNGWDGFLCTGKKWPEGDKPVTRGIKDRKFWAVRRAVEDALCEASNLIESTAPGQAFNHKTINRLTTSALENTE